MFLVLVDSASGKSLLREMNYVANSRKIPLLQIEKLDEITSIANCKAVAIKNKPLSDEIIKLIKGE